MKHLIELLSELNQLLNTVERIMMIFKNFFVKSQKVNRESLG